jgi:inositol oxygenase
LAILTRLFQYLYNVLKDQSSLPIEALAIIRYHSFYPYVIDVQHSRVEKLIGIRSWHREGAYSHLTNERDEQVLEAVREFNPYDLYSKGNESCDRDKLKPYYQRLVSKFFPPILDW